MSMYMNKYIGNTQFEYIWYDTVLGICAFDILQLRLMLLTFPQGIVNT